MPLSSPPLVCLSSCLALAPTLEEKLSRGGATREELKPVRIPDTTLAFMFESTYLFSLTEFAEVADNLDQNYYKCWQPLDKHFAPDQP